MKIAVAGTGYVGLSLAVLLAQNNDVTAVDINPDKVNKVNQRISPIQDEMISTYLKEKPLHLQAAADGEKAYAEAEYVIIATPTNYHRKGLRNSRVVPPFPEFPRCLSPFQGNLFSLHCLDS